MALRESTVGTLIGKIILAPMLDCVQRGSLGPPYGLLQGSMALLDGNFPREGNIVARYLVPCATICPFS